MHVFEEMSLMQRMAGVTEKASVVMTMQAEGYKVMIDVADRPGGGILRYREPKQRTYSSWKFAID